MSIRQRGYVVLREHTLKSLLKRLSDSKSDALIRKGSFSTDVIWQNRHFVFPKDKKAVRESMWIFRNVLNEVRDFATDRKINELKPLPVNHWNQKLQKFRGKITATDIDHAYWRIAYLNGYITEKTYKKGLSVKDKSLRLASLANLSSDKEFQIIKKGVITENVVSVRYDPLLHKIYSNIRYECYSIMMDCSKLLGEEFICYKTDCIYYKDSEENRKVVQEYLEKRKMLWKQLVEPERPKKESYPAQAR